jgi:hypothetical protein
MKRIYFLLIIAVLPLIMTAQTDNDIIYHDFVPDTTVFLPRSAPMPDYSDTLRLDFNNDSINDIILCFMHYNSWGFSYSIISLNENWLVAWAKNDTLSSPIINWVSNGGYNPTPYEIDKKRGVRLKNGIDYYYGWFRIYEGVDATNLYFGVDKMAFCKIPNYPFLYGQTAIVTGFEKSLEIDKTNVFVADTGSSVVVNSDKKIENITITNIAGEQVAQQTKVNANNKTIKTANFAKGTYIVKVQFADGGVFTQKVVL